MFFWDVTHHKLGVTNRSFGTAYRFYLVGMCGPRRKINIKGRDKEETERERNKEKGKYKDIK